MKVKKIGGRKITQPQQITKPKTKQNNKYSKPHSLTGQRNTQNSKIQLIKKQMQHIHSNQNNRRKSSIVINKKTFNDQTIQSPGRFIECIDDYIDQLDQGVSVSATNLHKNRHSGSLMQKKLQEIDKKINKQKQINRNLQKNVIQIQKLLWKRTQKLQKLQKIVKIHRSKDNKEKHIENQRQSFKENYQNHNNRQKYKHNQCLPSEDSELYAPPSISLITDSSYEQPPRRNTQLPSEIQKIISKTLGLGYSKRNSKQHLKHFLQK